MSLGHSLHLPEVFKTVWIQSPLGDTRGNFRNLGS